MEKPRRSSEKTVSTLTLCVLRFGQAACIEYLFHAPDRLLAQFQIVCFNAAKDDKQEILQCVKLCRRHENTYCKKPNRVNESSCFFITQGN